MLLYYGDKLAEAMDILPFEDFGIKSEMRGENQQIPVSTSLLLY